MTRPIQEVTNPLVSVRDELANVSSISSEELDALKTNDELGEAFIAVENAVLTVVDHIGTSSPADDLT